MKHIPLFRAISLALGCCAALNAGAAYAQDKDASDSDEPEEETVGVNRVIAGLQYLDADGDVDNLESYSDGLNDPAVIELLQLSGGSDRKYYSLEGRDLGQKDQSLDVAAGIYGKLKVNASWVDQFRNYTDGVSLGSQVRPNYWAVSDATQALLESGFTPQGGNPTPAGVANLRSLLADAPMVSLEQKRRTGKLSAELTVLPGLHVRAGFNHEDREGLKAVSNGGYSRASTGATAIGGLGENFRLYGLEFPMPIDYETFGVNFGADYRAAHWFLDVSYAYTKFKNNIDALVYDNPLLLNSRSGVGGASMRQMVLAPDYDGTTFSFTAGIRDLPLQSQLTATYSNDTVNQDTPFQPYTANPILRDDDGRLVATLAPPQTDLNGEVNTQLFNLVLSSHPIDRLSTNVRFNRYDYNNNSDVITWDGWAAVGESSWRDQDGSVPGQPLYRNRVPEYTRTRSGMDATYTFSSDWRLSGEYVYESYDRNADRYADNKEDLFRVWLTALPTDFATIKITASEAHRDIDGHYAELLQNGFQDEFVELRMFDQAKRDRSRLDLDADIDIGSNFSVGLSFSRYKDVYDKEFYGLQDFTGFLGAVDLSLVVGERFTASAYYNRDEFESNQRNRAKSNAAGGGAFAVPENDFDSYLDDKTDSYGLGFDAILIPEKLSLRVSLDISDSVGTIKTINPNYLSTATTSSATAYVWPQTKVNTKDFVVALNYDWSVNLKTGLRYTYMSQDITDFASDLTDTYLYPLTDTQGNKLSHFVFMDANPFDYRANVYMATLEYRF